MALMPEDIEKILEATKPCPSSSIDLREVVSGSTGGRLLPAIDYEDRLAQRTAKSRRKLSPRSKPDIGNVISMGPKKF